MRKDIALVAVIVASLMLMVIPLDPMIIDILLAVNITLAVMLLMVSIYLKHPSDFSTFPSVILIGTAFRLALSIGTTRLILSEAEAGAIIETFGEFVVSGSIAIGLVIFLIITVVQFIVVTKGAERVAEVGARFALDALPGKQMSIDAEARAGNITADQAADRRQRLDRESRFFGAMDGAMKFVKGDAIAGIIIIYINLLGGIAVGMSTHGLGFSEAVGVFSLLTIGDGLVAQIPALLMSLCAGIIVTRAEGKDGKDLGSDISAELIADPRVPAIGAPIVLGIGLIPGFPTLIFAAMAVAMLLISAALRRAIRSSEQQAAAASAEPALPEAALEDQVALPVDGRVRVFIGAELAADADLDVIEARTVMLLSRLYEARGIRFARPEVISGQIADPRGVVIEIDEVPVLRDTAPLGHALFVLPTERHLSLDAAENNRSTWPLVNGIWVGSEEQADLEFADKTSADLAEMIGELVFRVYERNLGALFSHGIFNGFMEEAREAEPHQMQKVEEEIDDGSLYKMFRYLVEDGVPLRPISLVISSIRYWLVTLDDTSPITLAECLRGSMKRQLCHRIAGEAGLLGLALLDPALEARLRRSLADQPHPNADLANAGLSLDPETNDLLLDHVRKVIAKGAGADGEITLVVTADLRRRLRNHLAMHNLNPPVLAPHEIAVETPSYPLELVGDAAGERQAIPASRPRRASAAAG